MTNYPITLQVSVRPGKRKADFGKARLEDKPAGCRAMNLAAQRNNRTKPDLPEFPVRLDRIVIRPARLNPSIKPEPIRYTVSTQPTGAQQLGAPAQQLAPAHGGSRPRPHAQVN